MVALTGQTSFSAELHDASGKLQQGEHYKLSPLVLHTFRAFRNVPILLLPVCLECRYLKRALPYSLFLSLWSEQRHDASAFRDTNALCLHIYNPLQKKYPCSLFCLGFFRFSLITNSQVFSEKGFEDKRERDRDSRTRHTSQDDIKGLKTKALHCREVLWTCLNQYIRLLMTFFTKTLDVEHSRPIGWAHQFWKTLDHDLWCGISTTFPASGKPH